MWGPVDEQSPAINALSHGWTFYRRKERHLYWRCCNAVRFNQKGKKGCVQVPSVCVCVRLRDALLHPLRLFSGSSFCTFQVEATANKRLKVQVKYVSFLSLLSRTLLGCRVGLRAETRVGRKVKGERITQDTLQIKVSVQ